MAAPLKAAQLVIIIIIIIRSMAALIADTLMSVMVYVCDCGCVGVVSTIKEKPMIGMT